MMAFWALMVIGLVGLGIVIASSFGGAPSCRTDGAAERAHVAMHRARGRLVVMQLKSQMKADAARLRRELEQEFDEADRPGGER